MRWPGCITWLEQYSQVKTIRLTGNRDAEKYNIVLPLHFTQHVASEQLKGGKAV